LKPRSIITVARSKLALVGRGGTVDVTNGCMPATNRVLKDKYWYRHRMGTKKHTTNCNDQLVLNGKTPRRLQSSFPATAHP